MDIPSEKRPQNERALFKLIEVGQPALKSLILSISDDRETDFYVEGFTIMTGSEYEPRFGDKLKQPALVNGSINGTAATLYRLRVGDLAFFAIGQICNRRLAPLRYRPTGIFVVNSPVAVPELAKAVKLDWEGITRADHCASLVEDLSAGSSLHALKRLCYYYPDAAKATVLALCKRAVFFEDEASSVVESAIKGQDELQWDRSLDKSRTNMSLNQIHGIAATAEMELRLAKGKSTEAVLTRFANHVDKYLQKHGNSRRKTTELGEFAELVRHSAHLKSSEIDVAIETELDAMIAKRMELCRRSKFLLDDLALAYDLRMKSNPMALKLTTYFQTRIDELAQIERTPAETQRLLGIKERLKSRR